MIIILLGPPCAGKGTQASLLAKRLGLAKLSTGDMLRDAIENKKITDQSIIDAIASGGLVPDSFIIDMIRVQLESESCAAGAVLDGFPRTLEQASSLDEMLRRLGKNIDYVLQLKVDDAQLIERMALRYNCSNCGATYNRKTKLPKQENICDECGASDFTARSDDEIEVFKHRLVTYHEKTNPLIEYYAQKGLLQSIDGMQDVAALSKEIALIAV